MSVINILLLMSSIALETIKNLFSNGFSKSFLKTDTDIYKFNVFSYIGSFLAIVLFLRTGCSLFTIICAVFFAFSVNLNQVFFLKALSKGPMSLTCFVQGSGLIISTVFGVMICNEKIKLLQVLMLIVLIFSMGLALDVKKGKFEKGWLIYAFLAMVFMGLIGVMQTYHQISDYKDELIPFLAIAFMISAVINIPLWKFRENNYPSAFAIKSKAFALAIASGAFMGAVHIINLYLSGAMPKVFFFPVVNGGLIFVTLISGVIFFKEKLNKKQIIGVILGTIALSFIGL